MNCRELGFVKKCIKFLDNDLFVFIEDVIHSGISEAAVVHVLVNLSRLNVDGV
jgi:hypothetical protein